MHTLGCWTRRDAGAILKALDGRERRREGGGPLEAGASVTMEGVPFLAGLGFFPVCFREAVSDLLSSGALEGAERVDGGGAEVYTVTARALEMLREGGESAN